jgi:sterol desaturase/sphingolipid hydroxylase (fatty acid hydroxylase superfamily)
VGLIAASTGFFLICERLWPYDAPSRRWIHREAWSDLLFYSGLQPVVIGALVAGLAEQGFLTPLRSELHELGLGRLPFWAQLGFFVVSHDFLMYWLHRWQHASKGFWRLHEAHHSPYALNWLSGARSHPVEMLIFQTLEFLPIFLLGGDPQLAVAKGVVDAVTGQWIHANVRFRLGPLIYVLNGPEMHRWHHVDDPQVYHRNLATKFALWDWLFGTAYLPGSQRPKNYGLRKEVMPSYPQTYWGQVAAAFRGRRAG